jgi:hypothetical protein
MYEQELIRTVTALQKKGNQLSGTELQRAKEEAAEKMREKQRLGMDESSPCPPKGAVVACN